jgi:integrase
MKVQRNGKAAALTEQQLEALLAAAPSAKHHCLWMVQRWSAARIGEALSLSWADVGGKHVTFKKSSTKTKTQGSSFRLLLLLKSLLLTRSTGPRSTGTSQSLQRHCFQPQALLLQR